MKSFSFPLPLQIVISNSLASLIGRKENFFFCTYLNISVCPLTESAQQVRGRVVA